MIQPRYRREYKGEFVITQSRWSNGVKHQDREWIPNAIENHHISGRAAVIGSKCDMELFEKQEYSIDNIVFTDAKNCIRYPNNFYLIPYTPPINHFAAAIYMAAFDGHTEVFLLGYSNSTPHLESGNVQQINEVFQAYNTTNFILVGVAANMPDMWRNNRNVQCMDYRHFVSYCDV